ncbi:MAG: hypothetical protein ACLGI8_02840 [Acidimicrobiia bacterium]|jgi:hypothetical protein
MTERTTPIARTAAVLVLLAGLAACGDDGPSQEAASTTQARAAPVIDPGDGGAYDPQVDPADFVEGVDNPFLPLVPGTRWVYEGESDGEHERIEVEVTDQTRTVMGITAVVVRDTVYVDGELAEDTYDWFAQDREGNVWYLGEDTHEYEDGQRVNDAGAWEAGVDGALPGIVMSAHPEVGDAFRQEYLPGEAEDMGEILAVGVAKTIGLGTYDDVVVTEDWTPLEPDVVEEKWYARGIGLIYERAVAGTTGSVELIEHTAP